MNGEGKRKKEGEGKGKEGKWGEEQECRGVATSIMCREYDCVLHVGMLTMLTHTHTHTRLQVSLSPS